MTKKKFLKTMKFMEYNEVIAHVESQLGYFSNDAAGKYNEECDPAFTDMPKDQRPYLNFWHWLVDRTDMRGRDLITIDDIESDEEWVNNILLPLQEIVGDHKLWVEYE